MSTAYPQILQLWWQITQAESLKQHSPGQRFGSQDMRKIRQAEGLRQGGKYIWLSNMNLA